MNNIYYKVYFNAESGYGFNTAGQYYWDYIIRDSVEAVEDYARSLFKWTTVKVKKNKTGMSIYSPDGKELASLVKATREHCERIPQHAVRTSIAA